MNLAMALMLGGSRKALSVRLYCSLTSPAWSTVILVNGQPQFLHPVLYCVVTWNLSALAFKHLAEDFQNLNHGTKTAICTSVYQYAQFDYKE